MTRKRPEDLRSARWFARDDFRSFGQRSRMNQMGYSAADYAGKPLLVIPITGAVDLADPDERVKPGGCALAPDVAALRLDADGVYLIAQAIEARD